MADNFFTDNLDLQLRLDELARSNKVHIHQSPGL